MARSSIPQIAAIGELLDRGVWVAPWIGPNGEVVLLAVTDEAKLAVEPFAVPHGASRVDAADKLWDAIELRESERPTLTLL